jgi:hypothetical protein
LGVGVKEQVVLVEMTMPFNYHMAPAHTGRELANAYSIAHFLPFVKGCGKLVFKYIKYGLRAVLVL